MIHYYTTQGQYTVEAAADPGYYTGQYQHQQAQDFYSQVRVVSSLSSLGDSKEICLKRQQFNECACFQYSEEPQATLAGDTDR